MKRNIAKFGIEMFQAILSSITLKLSMNSRLEIQDPHIFVLPSCWDKLSELAEIRQETEQPFYTGIALEGRQNNNLTLSNKKTWIRSNPILTLIVESRSLIADKQIIDIWITAQFNTYNSTLGLITKINTKTNNLGR